MANRIGNAQKKNFKITGLALLLLVFLFGPLAQGADKAAPAEAPPANYEELLDKYYNIKYGNDEFIPGLLKNYKTFANKTDSRFSYIDGADFAKAAKAKFKESWKTAARKVLTLKELQFMVVYAKSKTKASLDSLNSQVMDPASLDKLFSTIPVPNPVKPNNPNPPTPQPPGLPAGKK